MYGDRAIVKLLLDAGADVNAHIGGKYGSALQAANYGTRDKAAI